MERREPYELLVGLRAGAATVENSVEVPQKIKNVTTVQPSVPTSRHLSKENKNNNLKRFFKYP